MKLLRVETTYKALMQFLNFAELQGIYQTYLDQKPFPYAEIGEGEFLIIDMCVMSDKQASLTLKKYNKEIK